MSDIPGDDMRRFLLDQAFDSESNPQRVIRNRWILALEAQRDALAKLVYQILHDLMNPAYVESRLHEIMGSDYVPQCINPSEKEYKP